MRLFVAATHPGGGIGTSPRLVYPKALGDTASQMR